MKIKTLAVPVGLAAVAAVLVSGSKKDDFMTTNVLAFLKMIRKCEGTADADGYRRLFGGRLITDLSKHPNIAVTAGGYTSTAAGAYQFLYGTWIELAKKYGVADFSAKSQDYVASRWLSDLGITKLLDAGNVESAIAIANKKWASLPGSPYGQPVKSLAQAKSYYQLAGGTFV